MQLSYELTIFKRFLFSLHIFLGGRLAFLYPSLPVSVQIIFTHSQAARVNNQCIFIYFFPNVIRHKQTHACTHRQGLFWFVCFLQNLIILYTLFTACFFLTQQFFVENFQVNWYSFNSFFSICCITYQCVNRQLI